MPSLLWWLMLAQASPQVVVTAPAERQQLRWGAEVWCVQLPPTAAVPSGQFRVQCDEEQRQCLVAPQRLLVDGVESEQEVARTELCLPLPDEARLKNLAREGFRFVEAVAEAPPGWFRDERGRILQVNFDLHRRIYFGGAWSPQYGPGSGFQLGRARTDFGIELDFDANQERELHRLRLLEGSAWLGSDPRVDAALARYSFSAQRLSPMFWLTSFVGKPRRLDLDLNLTGWFELLRWELVAQRSFLTLGSAAAALDLWHSRNLDSYLRVRAGPAAEYDLQTRSVSLKPFAALEGDFTLDRDGFHHLAASVEGEKLFFDPVQPGRRPNPSRLRLKAGYEVILLAINDYPLTFLLDAGATWREDLVDVKPGWEFSAHAGLRFSFWAPARRDAGPVSPR